LLPEDIKEMAYPVLRHRISLNYEALAEEIKVDNIIEIILQNVNI
jgi:MoxR-like ATPase